MPVGYQKSSASPSLTQCCWHQNRCFPIRFPLVSTAVISEHVLSESLVDLDIPCSHYRFQYKSNALRQCSLHHEPSTRSREPHPCETSWPRALYSLCCAENVVRESNMKILPVLCHGTDHCGILNQATYHIFIIIWAPVMLQNQTCSNRPPKLDKSSISAGVTYPYRLIPKTLFWPGLKNGFLYRYWRSVELDSLSVFEFLRLVLTRCKVLINCWLFGKTRFKGQWVCSRVVGGMFLLVPHIIGE
jgi:hypothetical protein